MSALIGIVVLALFTLALFVAIPFVLAPLVLGGMYLHRRRQLGSQAAAAVEPATISVTRTERPAVTSVAQAA